MNGPNVTITISDALAIVPGRRKELYILLSCPFLTFPSSVLQKLLAAVSL